VNVIDHVRTHPEQGVGILRLLRQAAMNDTPSDASLRQQARIAACCYLFVIAGGVFAALFVRDALFVPSDPAATLRAIAANESLWRFGIAVHLIYLLAGATFNVILYRLFRPAGATLALLTLVLGMSDVAIEAVLLTGLYVPLYMVRDAGVVTVLSPEQRDVLAYLGVRVFLTGWSFALLLFSGFCAGIGVLIVRSRLIPRTIGVLMIAAGISYFVNAVVGILSPSIARTLVPWILVPCFFGELSLAVWLGVRGLRKTQSVLA
jgi:hypothetical protein